jgi:hypothetical protein
LAVCVESEPAQLIGEFVTFGLEIEVDTADVLFRGVGVSYFAAQRDSYFKHFIGCHFVSAFYYRYVLFKSSVSCLVKISNFCHEHFPLISRSYQNHWISYSSSNIAVQPGVSFQESRPPFQEF